MLEIDTYILCFFVDLRTLAVILTFNLDLHDLVLRHVSRTFEELHLALKVSQFYAFCTLSLTLLTLNCMVFILDVYQSKAV